jgi:hypothetical protein
LGTSTIENVGSALGKAFREATEPANESSPKRSRGVLSGVRGVIVGAALGVLAAKKGGPLVESAVLNLEDAISKYVPSHAKEAPDQVDVPSTDVPSTDQAAAAPRPDEPVSTGAGTAPRYVTR